MKANKVLKILNITRPTLVKYVKDGTIRTITLPNGTYDYNDEDVYRKSGRVKERVSVTYSRVSTAKQKVDLENQEKALINWCNANGVKIARSYRDVASGMNFDRKQFLAMLDDILDYRIDAVYVTYKDRLSRISFDMFQKLFGEFGCKIVVINDTEDAKSNETEIFEEIISMLHCFAMKMYSKRRRKKLELVKEDLKNELSV